MNTLPRKVLDYWTPHIQITLKLYISVIHDVLHLLFQFRCIFSLQNTCLFERKVWH